MENEKKGLKKAVLTIKYVFFKNSNFSIKNHVLNSKISKSLIFSLFLGCFDGSVGAYMAVQKCQITAQGAETLGFIGKLCKVIYKNNF